LQETFQGEGLQSLLRIKAICNEGVTSFHDGDYGEVPSWYFHLSIGDYDKPFKVTVKDLKTVHTPVEPLSGGSVPNVTVVDYSEKAIAVIGDGTKAIKDELKKLGARPNFYLKIEGKNTFGWVFPKTKKQEVLSFLNL
jgi:hypothetical protein